MFPSLLLYYNKLVVLRLFMYYCYYVYVIIRLIYELFDCKLIDKYCIPRIPIIADNREKSLVKKGLLLIYLCAYNITQRMFK